jgi:hypothetical protein
MGLCESPSGDGKQQVPPGPLEVSECGWRGRRGLRIKGAKAGSGGLHSRPVRGCQGQLQGSADQATKVKTARSGVGRVAPAEGDDGWLGHQVPPVRGLRRRGGVQVQVQGQEGPGWAGEGVGLAGQG